MARMSRIVAGSLVAMAAVLGVAAAKDSMLATIDKPATLTATPVSAAMLGAADIGTGHVLVTVVAFTPPPDRKPVEAVVWISRRGGGPAQKVGSFAITPYAPFKARDPSMAQRFQFPLPASLAGQRTLDVSVALVPVGTGVKGASLEIGTVAFIR
jgi:hypothetical protein